MKNELYESIKKSTQLILKSPDPKVHKEAIGEILKAAGSKGRFNQGLKEPKNDLSWILIYLGTIPKEECVDVAEYKSMQEVSKRAKKFSKNKEYQKILELGYFLVLNNTISFLKRIEGIDVKLQDIHKEVPEELFFQFYLLELLALNPEYDWTRNDQIIKQSMSLAGMCFQDFYQYFHEVEEDIEDIEEDGLSEKDELYYDAMEWLNLGEPREAIKDLKKALKIDPEYVQTYVGLVAAYIELSDTKNERKYSNLGFEYALKKFPKWPARMEWGIMENRAYMRAICYKAMVAQVEGDLKTAEELYRLLLKMNPNDNQGVRYLISGMFEGISPDDVDDLTDEGNVKQDWSALENMVTKQNKIHKFWKAPRD